MSIKYTFEIKSAPSGKGFHVSTQCEPHFAHLDDPVKITALTLISETALATIRSINQTNLKIEEMQNVIKN